MKYVVVALVAVLSFLTGHYLFPYAKTLTSDSVKKCEQLLQFRPDFEAYQKLKTADERYRKADEILGKIMTVFLADLGLRMTSPLATAGVSGNPRSANSSDHREANQPAAKAQTEEPLPPSASPPENPRDWIRHENKLKDAISENDVRDSLKKLEIKDLFSELKNAKALSVQQLQMITGKYAGEISFFDNTPVWSVDWDLDARLANGKVVGKESIILAKDGKIFSQTTGDGTSKNFFAVPGSQAVLINVYGEDGYLQLYPNEHLDHLYANYYQKKGAGQFDLKGVANLRRTP